MRLFGRNRILDLICHSVHNVNDFKNQDPNSKAKEDRRNFFELDTSIVQLLQSV